MLVFRQRAFLKEIGGLVEAFIRGSLKNLTCVRQLYWRNVLLTEIVAALISKERAAVHCILGRALHEMRIMQVGFWKYMETGSSKSKNSNIFVQKALSHRLP